MHPQKMITKGVAEDALLTYDAGAKAASEKELIPKRRHLSKLCAGVLSPTAYHVGSLADAKLQPSIV
jgi:hypothetical protein